jgi:hypothetical protein
MKWPFVRRSEYDKRIKALMERLDAAISIIASYQEAEPESKET